MASKIFYKFLEISEFLGEGGIIAVVIGSIFLFLFVHFVF